MTVETRRLRNAHGQFPADVTIITAVTVADGHEIFLDRVERHENMVRRKRPLIVSDGCFRQLVAGTTHALPIVRASALKGVPSLWQTATRAVPNLHLWSETR